MISFNIPGLVFVLAAATFAGYLIGGHWFGWDNDNESEEHKHANN